jgi:hypothetical protein
MNPNAMFVDLALSVHVSLVTLPNLPRYQVGLRIHTEHVNEWISRSFTMHMIPVWSVMILEALNLAFIPMQTTFE